MNQSNSQMQTIIEELIQRAIHSGATGAAEISPMDIPVKDALAGICKDPGCPNYGLSPSCPPHVAGPSGFRVFKKRFSHALVIKIDVPSEILLSSESTEIFQLLHTIVADLESRAIELGCPEALSFAGGSCKQLFCSAHTDCRVLKENGPCRNPEKARPSMSGFGIKVSELVDAAGWKMNLADRNSDGEGISMGTVAGLVLLRDGTS